MAELLAHPTAKRPNAIARQIELLALGTIGRERVILALLRARLAVAAGVEEHRLSDDALRVDCPTTIRRRGVEARLVIGEVHRRPDPKLVSALGRAHRWLKDLRAGRASHLWPRLTGSPRAACASDCGSPFSRRQSRPRSPTVPRLKVHSPSPDLTRDAVRLERTILPHRHLAALTRAAKPFDRVPWSSRASSPSAPILLPAPAGSIPCFQA